MPFLTMLMQHIRIYHEFVDRIKVFLHNVRILCIVAQNLIGNAQYIRIVRKPVL